MKKLILRLLGATECKHIFDLDTQLKVVRCRNCHEKFWYAYQTDVFSPEWQRNNPHMALANYNLTVSEAMSVHEVVNDAWERYPDTDPLSNDLRQIQIDRHIWNTLYSRRHNAR